MPTPTVSRVTEHTDEDVNLRIRRETDDRIAYYADHPEEIGLRLAELDREWDIERAIEANAAILALAGTLLATKDKRWLVVPGLVTSFLLQHAVQGWCPPVPILRRLGFRTEHEIETERHALKVLRGDYTNVLRRPNRASAVSQAARA